MNTYIIYDADGEMIDVIEFTSQQNVDAYQEQNPSHVIELAKNELILDPSFEEDEEENDLYFDDEII